jgi:hypothetical protein
VSSEPRHSDNVARVEPSTGASAAPTVAGERRTQDNDTQAERAAAAREREFTVGGGDPEAGAPRAAPPVPLPLEHALARLRAVDRPSPFGVAHFPPLPAPPGVSSGR